MRKTLLIIIVLSLVLTISSCKRSDIVDPPWDGPTGYNVIVEGSASPAVLIVDGLLHICKITVRVLDAKGIPQTGRKILLQQVDAALGWLELGYFENNEVSIRKTTNSNGMITASFYVPSETDFAGTNMMMYIRAVLIVDGRTDDLALPQDYISLMLMQSK